MHRAVVGGGGGRESNPPATLRAALVISYELLMIVLCSSVKAAKPVPAVDNALSEPPAGLNGNRHAAAELYAADLAKGEVPGVRRIRRDLKVGQPRAQKVREYLAALVPAGRQASPE